MKQSLVGAILAVIAAQLSKVLYLLIVTLPLVKEGSLKLEHIVRFTKLAWIPLYCNIASYVNTLDVYIIVYFTQTTLPVALFRVAFILSSIVFYSASFSSALYPRILAKKAGKDVEETLRLTLMFAIPMTTGLIVLAKPVLCIFGVKYLAAYELLIILTAVFLILSTSRVFETVILGAEEVDLNKKARFKEYLKSNLFLLPTVQYLVHGAYLLLLAVVMALKPLDAALAWSIVFAASKIALTLWEYTYSKKLVEFKLPFKSIAKYLLASTVMVAVLLALKADKVIEVKIFTLMLKLTPYLFIGIVVYFAVLLAIDKYSRELLKGTLNLAKNTLTTFF